MTNPIDRSMARNILRLFDLCYKKGVCDAHDAEDDLAVQSWLEDVRANGSYGVAFEPDETCDWKHWRFLLIRWCRENRMSPLGYDVLDNVRQAKGFVYLIIPLSMRFYMMGVDEWLAYPNDIALTLFKATPKARWVVAKGRAKTMSTDDFVSLIQEFIYGLRKHPAQEMQNFSQGHFDSFEYLMWQMTRPINGKIRKDT